MGKLVLRNDQSVDYCAELRRTGHYYYLKGGHAMVRCPFHADGEPSMRLDLVTGQFAAGFFKCWGCGESGNWNKLAAKIGAKKQDDADSSARKYRDATVWDTPEQMLEHERWGLLPWRKSLKTDWRGIPFSLVEGLGGRLMIGDDARTRLFLPCYIDGTLVGGVACARNRSDLDDPGFTVQMRKYQNSSGHWTSTVGFLPYDYVQAHFDCSYVVLVEGPRDALRLISYGICALAVLGANLGGPQKAAALLALSSNLKHVFILPDPDNGGDKMKARWTKILDKKIPVTVFNLPRRTVVEEGREVDMDPGNMPESLIKVLKARIEKKVGAYRPMTFK